MNLNKINLILNNNLILKFSVIVLFILSLINFIIFSGNWSGDPEIHLVFSKNLINGHFIQFNQGEMTSGNTSQIYMMILSILLILFPDIWVPFIMKLTSLISIILLSILVVKELYKKLLIKNYLYFLLLLFSFFSFPFIFFQGWLGMENSLFGLIYFYLVLKVYNNQLFIEDKISISNLKLLFIIYLLFFFRPEIIFFLFGAAIYFFITKKLKLFSLGLSFTLLAFLTPKLFEIIFNVPLHGAGEVRTLLSQVSSHQINLFGKEIFINNKPFRLILYYFGFVIFLIIFFENNFINQYKKIIFLATCSIVPWFLHVTNILPNFHFSRYSIYFFFIFIVLFFEFIDVQKLKKQKNFFIVIILINSLSSFFIEHYKRDIWLDRILNVKNYNNITHKFHKNAKEKFSENICKKIDCTKQPINIGVFEVQVRLILDDRFIVRSLDGVVDYKLSNYLDKNGINIIDYIKYREIDYLFDLQKTYFNDDKFSLHTLKKLAVKEKLKINDIIFQRIDKNIIKVTRL